jgi:hypothetical protein
MYVISGPIKLGTSTCIEWKAIVLAKNPARSENSIGYKNNQCIQTDPEHSYMQPWITYNARGGWLETCSN